MSDRYPGAMTTTSRGLHFFHWWSTPPGSKFRKIGNLWILFHADGRYMAKDGVWRTPKEE